MSFFYFYLYIIDTMNENARTGGKSPVIIEKPIKGFNAPLKNSKNNYPQSTNPNAPRFFFNMLGIASRGGSKTYTTTRVIKDFEEHDLIDNDGVKHPLRTFLISPTANANKILKNLKSLEEDDIYDIYSDTNLKGILDDIIQTKEEVMKYKVYVEAYKLIMRTPKNKIPELMKKRPEVVKILEENDFIDPKEIEIRYREIPVNIIILDDCVGSSAFSRKSQNMLVNYLIKNRHSWVSYCILSQSVKAIPRTIRMNCNVFLLGKFASKKVVLEDMYEEISNVLTIEEFEKIYDYATDGEKYGMLVMDCSGDTKRFYKSYDSELFLVQKKSNNNIEDKKNATIKEPKSKTK
jgi:DNA-binding MarR family transcriptional regulator